MVNGQENERKQETARIERQKQENRVEKQAKGTAPERGALRSRSTRWLKKLRTGARPIGSSSLSANRRFRLSPILGCEQERNKDWGPLAKRLTMNRNYASCFWKSVCWIRHISDPVKPPTTV